MYENSNWSSILHSSTISNIKLNSIKKQLVAVPKFWRERFIDDRWQMILTDKMPEEYGGLLTQYYYNTAEKKIWINVDIPSLHNNIIYKGFACYVSTQYGDASQYATFIEKTNQEIKELNIFMLLRGNLNYTKFQLFVEMFSYVVETKGKNPNFKIDYTYQYIKKWVYGDIFCRGNINIPAIMKVGQDVIDDQISLVNSAYESLPAKLRKSFVNERWKIHLSNQMIGNNSIYGLCSSRDRCINIRSSSINITLTTYHEIGHYLDFKENFFNNRILFKKVFFEEKEAFHKVVKDEAEYNYAISNTEEYFAELFAYYMEDYNLVKICVSKSYEIMKSIIMRWL